MYSLFVLPVCKLEEGREAKLFCCFIIILCVIGLCVLHFFPYMSRWMVVTFCRFSVYAFFLWLEGLSGLWVVRC
jgi:hypothetical protein